MFFSGSLVLSAMLAIIVPSATSSPAPQASPGAGGASLRTIVTVKSSPYCNALAQHFNGAFVPLVGNDRTLDTVDVDLSDINDAFSHPDFAARLHKARLRIVASNDQVAASLPGIYDHISQLRKAAAAAKDPQAASEALDAAAALQSAYAKQKQLSIDLAGLASSMLEIEPTLQDHELGGSSVESNTIPKDMRDIKSYLRFDGRRDLITQSEQKAVDIAYDAAVTKCSGP